MWSQCHKFFSGWILIILFNNSLDMVTKILYQKRQQQKNPTIWYRLKITHMQVNSYKPLTNHKIDVSNVKNYEKLCPTPIKNITSCGYINKKKISKDQWPLDVFNPTSVDVTYVTLPKHHCDKVQWKYINKICKTDHILCTEHSYSSILLHSAKHESLSELSSELTR